MKKKTLIILGIILTILALGVGAYFAWKNRLEIVEYIPGISNEQIPPLQAGKEKLKVISSRVVQEYWVNTSESARAISYRAEGGDIIHINDSNQEELGINLGSEDSLIVKPSREGTSLFLQIKNDTEAKVIDAVNGNTLSYLLGITSMAWGEQSEKIATIGKTSETNDASDLIITDISKAGAAPQKIVTTFLQNDFTLQWPNKDALFLTQRPSADYVSDMWRVDIKGKLVSKFLSGRGLIVQWAPFGTRGLKFTTTEARNHKLALIDEKGGELELLRFITLPDKCVIMAPEQMYCAIPRDQAALARMTLPDDYLKRDVYFQDGIYQIDLTNNGIRAIFEDENPKIDATNLTVTEDKILFINRYDRKLYSLDLQ